MCHAPAFRKSILYKWGNKTIAFQQPIMQVVHGHAAGGMASYVAGTVKTVHFNDLRKAMIYGSVLASFSVEAFGLERLRNFSMEEISKRHQMLN